MGCTLTCYNINTNHASLFLSDLPAQWVHVLFPSDWGAQGVWMIRVIVLAWYEVPVAACCLTEHVGPLPLPVECQQAAL